MITEVYKWLQAFYHNIEALLICGDLIEAGILPMLTANEWGGLIHTLKMGEKSAMEMLGLIKKNELTKQKLQQLSLLSTWFFNKS